MKSTEIWNDVESIRLNSPLVHNITNYVVMNTTANALLALGASPVMAHAAEEVGEMASIASALVINIGTLSPSWVSAMEYAMATASERGIPIVFDPVGAGATSYRTDTCRRLLSAVSPSIIRGNASEIMALVDSGAKTRGVDSSADGTSALEAAAELSGRYECAVSVSGATDLITDGTETLSIFNGHPMLPKVTGLGCTATALTGAFAAVNGNMLSAASNAMAVIGICGEIAAAKSEGPGSLQLNILDELYIIDEKTVAERLRSGE